jgi:pimeloyl-ACP methyl ester carboxylesterase
MQGMGTIRDNRLRVAGATIFYRMRGAGPLLLILQGGPGDADAAETLCEQLADRYTVVTYDRRGQSRSTIDASTGPPTIATHGDDAHHLLAALTTEPALVFGSSFGGLLGLDLVARYPEQVSALVAHEPPAWQLLPDAERDRAVRALKGAVSTFHREGTAAAFRKIAVLAAIDDADREADVALPPPTPQAAANQQFFFSHDVPADYTYQLDLAALKAAPVRIVVAGGSNHDCAPYRCAAALAERLGASFVEFPGGHTGWLLRPRAFATKLDEVLRQ